VLLVGIGLMTVGGLIGTLAAPSVPASLSRLSAFTLQTSWIILLIALWAPSRRELRAAVWCWTGSVAVSCLDAVLRHGRDLNGRAFGLTTHPNELALLCVLTAGPATVLVCGCRGWLRLAALVCATLIPLGILYSGSRAGFFGYLAVLAVVLVVWQKRAGSVAALAGPALAAALILAGLIQVPTPNALQRVFVVQNPEVQHSLVVSNAERRDLLESTLERIERDPLTGQGFEFVTSAHDIYLQAWVSGGILALIGLALILLQTIRPAWLAFRATDGSFLENDLAVLAFGLSAGYAGYLVAALFQNVVTDRFLWLAPTLVACLLPQLAPADGRLRSAVVSPLRAALAFLSLLWQG
jgi:O-antigen ligase